MFGWFRKPKGDSAGTLERLETLERRLRSLSDDWEEFHDKVQRAVWRNAKRKDPAPEAEGLPDVPPEQPARNNLSAPGAGPDAISARIRALRGRRLTILSNGEN
jgi:hypothetical protein